MIFEDKSAECQHCRKKKLVLISCVKAPERSRDAYISRLQCDLCHREYTLRDGKLAENREERDPVAELMAVRKAEIDVVRNRRCPQCGGPLDDWLTCDWCHEKYSIEYGELVPRNEDDLLKQHKPQMREFYALNAQR